MNRAEYRWAVAFVARLGIEFRDFVTQMGLQGIHVSSTNPYKRLEQYMQNCFGSAGGASARTWLAERFRAGDQYQDAA